MKTFYSFFLITIILTSCSDNSFIQDSENLFSKPEDTQIGYLQFNSADDLIRSIKDNNSLGSRKKAKPNAEVSAEVSSGVFISLMAPIDTAINISTRTDDNIIRYEVGSYSAISQQAMIQEDNLSTYYALGYDSIVPDINFAKLLNIKGEIQVADTVYKISPRGTYFFLSSLESHFTDHFAEYEESDGVLIADNTYILDEKGIYRYATFNNDTETIDAEDDNLPESINDCQMIPYTELSNPFANEVDWDNLPKEKSNAKTIIGKIWQSIFGCNKGFHYKISKKRRVTGKLFYYDYRVYTCTGASVKMEKKNWIGWSGTEADKLTVDWKNVVIESTYKTNPPFENNEQPIVSQVENVHIPGFTDPEPTISILGWEFTQTDIKIIEGKTAKQVYDYLKSKLGQDIPGNARAYMIYGPTKIITIIPNGFKNLTNEKNCRVIFHDAWHLEFTFDFLNPGNWTRTIQSLLGKSPENPKLLSAEVRVAACLDGKWGGMTITKE